MKLSKIKGFSAIEAIVVLICIGIVGSIIYYKGFYSRTNDLIVKSTYAHVKKMVDLIEKQKRELGAYPMSLQAMIDKNEYLRPDGNSKGYTSEVELKQQWNGPYFRNYKVYPHLSGFHIDRHYRINLDNIYPGMTGILRRSFQNNSVLLYNVTNEESPGIVRDFHPIGEGVIKKCNGTEEDIVIVTQGANSFVNVYGNHLAPCGFNSIDTKIVGVTYFINNSN